MRRVEIWLGRSVIGACGAAGLAVAFIFASAGQLDPLTATIDGQICHVWTDECGNVCQDGYCALSACATLKKPMCLSRASPG